MLRLLLNKHSKIKIKKDIKQPIADELAGMDEDSDARAFLAWFASLNEWQLLFSQNIFGLEIFCHIVCQIGSDSDANGWKDNGRPLDFLHALKLIDPWSNLIKHDRAQLFLGSYS